MIGYPWFDQAEAHRQDLLREVGADDEDRLRHHIELHRSGPRSPRLPIGPPRILRQLRRALSGYSPAIALLARAAVRGATQDGATEGAVGREPRD